MFSNREDTGRSPAPVLGLKLSLIILLHLNMPKLDKTFMKAQTHAEAELDKKFPKDITIGERLREAWRLTCMTYGIDPNNPPQMEKECFSTRKHSR